MYAASAKDYEYTYLNLLSISSRFFWQKIVVVLNCVNIYELYSLTNRYETRSLVVALFWKLTKSHKTRFHFPVSIYYSSVNFVGWGLLFAILKQKYVILS